MALNWLECLIYGLISGFTEFLPVSAVAHRALFLKLLGASDDGMLRFCVHLGALVAVWIICRPMLVRIRRERKIASLPKNHRRRQPDFATLMEGRVFRSAAVWMLLLLLGYSFVWNLYERLWILSIFLLLNGVVLYFPRLLPSANKGAQSLSSLDSMLIGISSGLGIIPGISRVGCGMSTALIRGTERQYALELSFLLSIPAMLALSVIDVAGVVMAGGLVITLPVVINYLTAAAASFGAAYLAMFFMRYLAVKIGYSGFAYYSWGVALFALIIYLI